MCQIRFLNIVSNKIEYYFSNTIGATSFSNNHILHFPKTKMTIHSLFPTPRTYKMLIFRVHKLQNYGEKLWKNCGGVDAALVQIPKLSRNISIKFKKKQTFENVVPHRRVIGIGSISTSCEDTACDASIFFPSLQDPYDLRDLVKSVQVARLPTFTGLKFL